MRINPVGRDSGQDDEGEEELRKMMRLRRAEPWVGFYKSSQQKKGLGLAITSNACPGLYDRLIYQLRELDLVSF